MESDAGNGDAVGMVSSSAETGEATNASVESRISVALLERTANMKELGAEADEEASGPPGEELNAR